MKILKKHKILCVGVVIILLILGWRFWPHSSNRIIPLDMEDVEDFYCIASVGGIGDNGEPYVDFYELQSLIEDDKDFRAVMEILADNRYRTDFRNLLPWDLESVSTDGNYDGKSVLIKFVWGDNGSEEYDLHYLSGSVVGVGDSLNGGFKVYHPTDREALDRLVEYIQKHGVKK